MFTKTHAKRGGLFKGIAAVYFILILHVVLIAALGVVVVFLTGLANYLAWILMGGMTLLGLSAYLFWQKLRREGKSLGDALQSPTFQGREVEVSLLGGMAVMRLGRPADREPLPSGNDDSTPLLEDARSRHIREIQALADLLEKKLITQKEFDQAKRLVFQRAEGGG